MTGTSRRRVDGHVLRPEIQALRALAVGLVVVYHLWPTRLTGGYVGVDVFFVISGYLITSHIARGLTSDKPFSLSMFYVRRARRLLPASLLVLTVVGLVTLIAVPKTLWYDFGRQIIASALYFENWVLAADAVDYLAAASDASPVQHFWSLSVEEQFYILWPLMMVTAAALATRFKTNRATVLFVCISLVTAISFVYSLFATSTDQAAAYFITPTRAWEFGLGGVAAFVFSRPIANRAFAAVVGWLGLAGIFAAAWFFDSATPFPGVAALLPVLATIGVIAAGNVGRWWSPSLFANRRPVQVLGDISYSVYLWHWPLIILLPIAIGGVGTELDNPMRIAIVILTLLLAVISKRYVEDKFRSPRPGRPWRIGRSVAAVAAGMAVVSLVGGVAVGTTASEMANADQELAVFESGDLSCFGASSLLEDRDCAEDAQGQVFPDPLIAKRSADSQGCQQRAARADVITCHFGSSEPGARRVALVGDSHANQWLPAMRSIAEEGGWSLTTYFKSSCAFSEVRWTNDSCNEWNQGVGESLSNEKYDTIIMAASSSLTPVAGSVDTRFDVAVGGYKDAWRGIEGAGSEILALLDTPRPGRAGVEDPPSCVYEGRNCVFAEAEALGPDPIADASRAFPSVRLIDMTSYFCRSGSCPGVIGNVLVYRDDNHMTTVYAKTLAEPLGMALVAAGGP